MMRQKNSKFCYKRHCLSLLVFIRNDEELHYNYKSVQHQLGPLHNRSLLSLPSLPCTVYFPACTQVLSAQVCTMPFLETLASHKEWISFTGEIFFLARMWRSSLERAKSIKFKRSIKSSFIKYFLPLHWLWVHPSLPLVYITDSGRLAQGWEISIQYIRHSYTMVQQGGEYILSSLDIRVCFHRQPNSNLLLLFGILTN